MLIDPSYSLGDAFFQGRQLYTEAFDMAEEAIFLEENIMFYGNPDNHQKYEDILAGFEERLVKQGHLTEVYRRNLLKEISFLKNAKKPKPEEWMESFIRWIQGVSQNLVVSKKEKMYLALETAGQIRREESLRVMIETFERYLTKMNLGEEASLSVSNEVAATISYIEQHYMEADMSLTNAALSVDMNKDYLCNLFRRETGVSFTEYVNIKRIRKAEELLVTTHMKVYQVALEVGFQDESYFGKVFKKIVGMRPNEYKRSVI